MDDPAARRGWEQGVIGRTIAGRFRVDTYLGGGAMGVVYKARWIALDKDVALKLMHGKAVSDPTFAGRFQDEARAASKLDHPNSVRVVDFGEEPDGLLYIAMEYLDGRDLHRVIRDDWPLAMPRVADIVAQALAALAVAHEAGMIHRDLKPENIMVLRRTDDEGRASDLVKVCDFGIAKFTEREEPSARGSRSRSGPLSSSMRDPERRSTTQGLVLGTPEYMSPEQGRGEPLDARTDLYSMGVILYQLLTGRLPFDADTPLGVVLKQVTEEAVPPRTVYPACDPRLEAICLKAMKKKRDERYATARDMRADLRAFLGAVDPARRGPPTYPPSGLVAGRPSGVPHARRERTQTRTRVPLDAPVALTADRAPRVRRLWMGMIALVASLVGGLAVWELRLGMPSSLRAIEAASPATLAMPPATSLEPLAVPSISAASADIRTSSLKSSGSSSTKTAAAAARTALPAARPAGSASLAPATPTSAPALAPLEPTAVAPPEPTTIAPPSATSPPAAVASVGLSSAVLDNGPPLAPHARMRAEPSTDEAPAAFDSGRARVDWSVVGTGGGATPGAVQRALARAAASWTQCYKSALDRRRERIEGGGVLHLVTDESGNVITARVDGIEGMPGIKPCIANAAHVRIEGVDTGDAWADVHLTLRAD
jgi:serine/threonine-protein kinase